MIINYQAIEACSSLAVKSIEMRDIVAAFGSLHMCELLSMYYQIISKEFASVIAKFLCDLCHLEPVSEFILRRVANAARYLLRHEVIFFLLFVFCEHKFCYCKIYFMKVSRSNIVE